MVNTEGIEMQMWLGGRVVELPQWQLDAIQKWDLSRVGTQEELLKTLTMVPDAKLAIKAAKTLVQLDVIKGDLMKDPQKHFISSSAEPLNLKVTV